MDGMTKRRHSGVRLWLAVWRAAAAVLLGQGALAQGVASAATPAPAVSDAKPVQKSMQKPAQKSVQQPAATRAAAGPVVVTKPGFSYTVAPMPAWVVPAAAPAGAPTEAAAMHYRVIDDQARVGVDTTANFTRVIRVVNQAAGLAAASQIELDFDPSYQKLAVHRLDVLRDGQRSSRLERSRIELLQRETQLEQRIYDGRVTVSVVVDDVRVGDEIEFAYTLDGRNPVFGGKHVHIEWLASFRGPALLVQYRLLAPEGRTIRHLKGPNDAIVDTRVADGQRETVFRRQNVAQLRPEPNTPLSALLQHQLQFSEFADWAEVAAWGEALFSTSAAAGPRTAAKADALRAEHADPVGRVLAALRFVQQDVRYLGVEMGASTHKPHPADQVLEQRFGDCKDKVSLLVALLRQLDVPVRPVLVSTRLRGRTDRMLPSPLAFDHVIARVDMAGVDAGGAPLWLDATRGHQSGPLAARQSRDLGQGLELAAGVTALATLPPPFDRELLQVEDRLLIASFAEDVTLESRIVYRGDLAEGLREAIATRGLPALADALAGPYLRAYPKLRRLDAVETADVADDDAIAVVQRFALPDFWRFPEQRFLVGEVVQWGPVDLLVPPKSEARRDVLQLPNPGVVRHQVRVEFPEEVYAQPLSRHVDDGDAHFTLQQNVEGAGALVRYDAEVRILADQVEPAQWTGFLTALNRALPKLGSVVVAPAMAPAAMEALKATGQRLEEDLRRGRLKVVTSTQAQSHFKRAALTAQIDSGRLAPALRAQALVARGIANDHLGQLEEAQRDFDAALALDGTSLEALNAAATNAQGRGDWARAVALASDVLKQQPRDTQALGTRALARYLAGQVPEAMADWQAALGDRASVHRGYPLLWLALATRRNGQPLAPLVTTYPRSQWPTEWPRPLLDAVFDGTDASALLKQAKAGKAALENQTEAYFYLGERFAVEGDTAQAREQWQRARELGVVEFVEYNVATQRLAAPR